MEKEYELTSWQRGAYVLVTHSVYVHRYTLTLECQSVTESHVHYKCYVLTASYIIMLIYIHYNNFVHVFYPKL